MIKVESFACDEAGAARIGAVAGPDRLTAADALIQRPDLSLVAVADGADRACASVWWSRAPPLPGHRPGIVGHYAAADAEAGSAVLEAACDALRARGATLAIGPMDADTWHRYRLVTWRGDEPRFLLEPDNPADWQQHFVGARFAPLARYHSACCDDLSTLQADAAAARRHGASGFRLRALDRGRIDAELRALWETARDAFAGNFLYTPLGEAEFRRLYRSAVTSLPPALTTIVERDGNMVGFLFAYPETMRAARGEPVDTVVLKTLGVVETLKRQGIGRWLFDGAVAAAREAGYRRAILALIHDDNPSARLGREARRLIRRYTLYGRPL